ncbi:hypothetical protein KTE69_06450 [Burkholderia multivorans]|nr:hypothetical protein [Burkholderia multivorans]PRD91831.1 hypothetical protein C6P76_00555 [Burkholderia multivorans]PRH17129.1 hypothetical protein C6T56_19935 [Burkholderia multivorans]
MRRARSVRQARHTLERTIRFRFFRKIGSIDSRLCSSEKQIDIVRHMSLKNTKNIEFSILYLIVAVFVVLYVRHNWGYAVDDSYITFRYADNLRYGYGLRFNVDERFYGTTAAGYALLVYFVSFPVELALRFSGAPLFIGAGHASIPIAGTVLSALSIGGVAALLVRVVQLRAANVAGWFFACLSIVTLFTSAAANAVSSHETYTFLFLALASTYAYLLARRPVLGAVVMALACTVRPDTILLAGMLFGAGACLSRRSSAQSLLQRFREPLLYATCLGCLMVGWLIFVRWNFGAFLPETLIAKKAQMLLKVFPGFNIANLKTQMHAYGMQYILAVGVLTIAAAIFVIVQKRAITPFLKNEDLLLLALVWAGYAAGDTVAYLSFGVSIWAWYVIAIMFASAFAVFSVAVVVIGEGWAQGRFGRGVVVAIGTFGAVVVLYKSQTGVASVKEWLAVRNINEHIVSYVPAAEFIRKANPNGTVIVTCEPGAFAFRLGPKFEVVDELGLVSPGVARKIVEGDMDYPFKRWNPKYIVISWHGPYTPEGRPWLDRDFRRVLSFGGPYWDTFKITVQVFEKFQRSM